MVLDGCKIGPKNCTLQLKRNFISNKCQQDKVFTAGVVNHALCVIAKSQIPNEQITLWQQLAEK